MKRKLSLKTRLMFTTSILLVFVCLALTLFSIVNAYFHMVKPFENMIIENLQSQGIDNVLYLTQNIVVQADDFFMTSFIFMMIAIIIGCSLTYVVAKISLKPLKVWSEEMSTIDHEQLSHRIYKPNTKDELDTLADAFNHLLDRLENAFQREKRFSASAAHELKTPLTVVKTNIEVLQVDDHPTQEDYKETIDIIQKQNDRMIKLVNDLMLMSSSNTIENDHIIDIDMILDELFVEFKTALFTKNIDLTYNKIGFFMKGNPTLIKHVFSNLIENAIKYNVVDGKIKIIQTIDDSKYTISICDTGIGIQDKDIPYIFEPFYRADQSRSRKEGGSGLGLAITKEIIENHHGHIEYRKQTEGSEFLITIPLNVIQDNEI